MTQIFKRERKKMELFFVRVLSILGENTKLGQLFSFFAQTVVMEHFFRPSASVTTMP